MKDEGPDRVFIRKSDRKTYDKLQKDVENPFKGKQNRVLYMAALALGFTEGERLELGKKEGYILLNTLENEDKAIIKAIAVADEGLEVLIDKKRVFNIADEYAVSGIRLLKDKVISGEYGSYIKRLESDLIEKYDEIKKNYE